MKKVKDAKFIESLINQNDLKAFVCSNREDLKLFLNEVCYIFIITFSSRTFQVRVTLLSPTCVPIKIETRPFFLKPDCHYGTVCIRQ